MKSMLRFRSRWGQALTILTALASAALYADTAHAAPDATQTSTPPINDPSAKSLDSMAPTSAGAKPSGKAWDLFNKLDKNHDNMLSREEVQPLPAVADKFDSLDKGGKGYLNYEEFKSGLKDAPSQTK